MAVAVMVIVMMVMVMVMVMLSQARPEVVSREAFPLPLRCSAWTWTQPLWQV